MHILSDGYSPVECFVEFVATGEFPETSSSAHRTNRSQASVAPAGLGGLVALCNPCVRPWGGRVNERSSALGYRASAGVTKSGEELGDSQREAGNEDKTPPLLRRFCSSPGSRVAIWYKQAHKGYRRPSERQEGGRWAP